ncbi:MAG TPA: hypothetical protein VI934_02775 [Candidatus Nanoarchaeia archaeon]|nr:hypothetical protein [Candidatus Nanoarchaeia archaeon]
MLNYFICLGAIYLGFQALREIRDGGGKRDGKLLALCSVVLSLIPYYFGLLYILISILRVSETLLAAVILLLPPAVLLSLYLLLKRYRLV